MKAGKRSEMWGACMDIPLGEVDKVAKLIRMFHHPVTIAQALEEK
jgi:tRNA A37 threonylcarbamoyltransferase TsaD